MQKRIDPAAHPQIPGISAASAVEAGLRGVWAAARALHEGQQGWAQTALAAAGEFDRFARLTADVLTPFLREHYAFDLAAKK